MVPEHVADDVPGAVVDTLTAAPDIIELSLDRYDAATLLGRLADPAQSNVWISHPSSPQPCVSQALAEAADALLYAYRNSKLGISPITRRMSPRLHQVLNLTGPPPQGSRALDEYTARRDAQLRRVADDYGCSLESAQIALRQYIALLPVARIAILKGVESLCSQIGPHATASLSPDQWARVGMALLPPL